MRDGLPERLHDLVGTDGSVDLAAMLPADLAAMRSGLGGPVVRPGRELSVGDADRAEHDRDIWQLELVPAGEVGVGVRGSRTSRSSFGLAPLGSGEVVRATLQKLDQTVGRVPGGVGKRGALDGAERVTV